MPLEPGTYQLYAAQQFTLGQDGHTSFIVHAGPWPVTVAAAVPGPMLANDPWTQLVADVMGNAYTGAWLDPGELTFGGCGARVERLAKRHLLAQPASATGRDSCLKQLSAKTGWGYDTAMTTKGSLTFYTHEYFGSLCNGMRVSMS